MKEVTISDDFDVDELSDKINRIMSRWSSHLLDINGPDWAIYDYEMDLK